MGAVAGVGALLGAGMPKNQAPASFSVKGELVEEAPRVMSRVPRKPITPACVRWRWTRWAALLVGLGGTRAAAERRAEGPAAGRERLP